MSKPFLTAQQITDDVQNLVNQIEEVVEDNAHVLVGTAYWHELDADGCNWNIKTIQNGASYANEILNIIETLRLKVNIIEP